jgi:RNA polymerase sigma factor (sigma-70 family)
MNKVAKYKATAGAGLADKNQDELVRKQAPLVKRIAYHLMSRLPPTVQVDDLVQSGMIGLLEASRNYDASQGASFETYAGIRIRGAMLDEIRKGDWAPRSLHRKVREISRVVAEIEAETGRDARDALADRPKKFLCDDPFHIEGDSVSDRFVQLFGEQVQDPADGRRGRGGVDGTEDQVPRFGRMDGGHKGLFVPHFTDEDDVWVLAHGVFHGDAEVFDVGTDFALVDQAFVFDVNKLDGVFERQDMFSVIAVDPIEHRGDRGTFSGSSHTSKEHHPLIVLAEVLKDRR